MCNRPLRIRVFAGAPWFDNVEIGWRINATLGVKTQVLREPSRTPLLTQDHPDLKNTEVVPQ
jgi:hypothetical protein